MGSIPAGRTKVFLMKQTNLKLLNNIPSYVTHVTKTLHDSGFEVFLVGGCVRDLLMNKEPKDWDLTTNAKPEEIIPLFEKTIYENQFGTVGVCIPRESSFIKKTDNNNVTCETNIEVTFETKYDIIEVTPYRIEANYTDFRHPNEVHFSDKIEDDLKRRDFTINSIAYNVYNNEIIDLYKGQNNIKDKIINTVGNPNDRFQEDALRMLRAIRFSVQLDFIVSYETMKAISDNSNLINNVSFERIRDEFTKIIMSKNPVVGIGLLQKLGLLKHIIPELEEGIGCEQGGAHKYDVFNHLLHALDHASKKGWGLEIRLSALFHDIGKPKSRRFGVKKAYTFYGHEVIGERIVKQILERLRYPKETSERILNFTRNHMFFSDTEKITLSAVRRIISHVGKENIWDLMKVRECDRVGMNKNEAPYRLRKYHAMIEEALHDPISVGQLSINGKYLIEVLHMKPGARMGWILNALLEEVLDDPLKNTKDHLEKLVFSLDMLGDNELKILGERGKIKKDELEQEEVDKLHKKHGV